MSSEDNENTGKSKDETQEDKRDDLNRRSNNGDDDCKLVSKVPLIENGELLTNVEGECNSSW